MAGIRGKNLQLSGCTRGCTLNPERYPEGIAEKMHEWFEAGERSKVEARMMQLGYKLSDGSISRHYYKHLVPLTILDTKEEDRVDLSNPRSELDILNMIIQRGAKQVDLKTFRVTAEQLLKSIELKHKLTEGSMFEDFFQKISEVQGEILAETEAATASEEEQSQAAFGEADVG